MKDPKSKLEVTIIKSPPLSRKDQADLIKKLENTLVHYFPELQEAGELDIRVEPIFPTPPKASPKK